MARKSKKVSNNSLLKNEQTSIDAIGSSAGILSVYHHVLPEPHSECMPN